MKKKELDVIVNILCANLIFIFLLIFFFFVLIDIERKKKKTKSYIKEQKMTSLLDNGYGIYVFNELLEMMSNRYFNRMMKFKL
jgi:hypothetical protein